MSAGAPHSIRRELRIGDEAAVRAIVESTGFFSAAETDIAVELVEERRAKGLASGYHFVFLDVDARTVAYACHGPIAGTVASWDLYWIAVEATRRGRGLGRILLHEAERDVAAGGGRRVYVDTSSRDTYAPTRTFYRRMGYHQAAELPGFYAPGDGKVIFCKVLADVAP